MFLYYLQILITRVFKPDVCFRKVNLLEPQTVHNAVCDFVSFTSATPLIFLLSVFFLQTKR